MQKVKKILTQYLWLFWLVVPMASRAVVDTGLGETSKEANLDVGVTELPEKVGTIVGALLELTGTVFFLLMIYAGITWMLAQGDPGKTKKAKETLVDAIIGLVLVFSAYAITKFVGENVSI